MAKVFLLDGWEEQDKALDSFQEFIHKPRRPILQNEGVVGYCNTGMTLRQSRVSECVQGDMTGHRFCAWRAVRLNKATRFPAPDRNTPPGGAGADRN